MDKAERSLKSAKILLAEDDAHGACNRAYYAMFDAARAALLASVAPVSANVARTHNGLISAFSLHLVKTGRVSVDLGRSLNRAEEIRLIADYTGDTLEPEQTMWVVEQAERFVQAMRAEFMENP